MLGYLLEKSEDINLINSPKIHEFDLVKLGISGGWSNLKVIKAIKKQMLPRLLLSQWWHQQKYGGDRPTPMFRPLPGFLSKSLLTASFRIETWEKKIAYACPC